MNALPCIRDCEASHQSEVTLQTLRRENQRFQGTGGRSPENRDWGFLPAFFDTHSGAVYLSRRANGEVAPIHLLDGLPSALVVKRSASGRVTTVSPSVKAGFVRQGRFYTREQAAGFFA